MNEDCWNGMKHSLKKNSTGNSCCWNSTRKISGRTGF
jgi:hypothetical protein